MNYQEFLETVQKHMTSMVPSNHKVTLQTILKNNGTTYDGITIYNPELNISPTIYLNPYYHRYLDGISLEDIFEDLRQTYETNLPKENFDVSLFRDFEKAAPKIIMKLVNTEKNKNLLKDVPHIPFLDLSIIFQCAICEFEEEFATILIHNQHLALWDVTTEELYSLAMKNTPKLLKYHFCSMADILEEMLYTPLPFVSELQMFLLTNEIRIHGATCMVYPIILEHIAKRLNDNLIIIPSSIHEVIIIPEKTSLTTYTLEDYKEQIQEVNETELKDDEILADHPYLYILETGEIQY